jgi:plasmid stabilization system protein ParE
MSSLLYGQGALDDLRRLAAFLRDDDPAAAESTAALIVQALDVLEAHPLVGRPAGGDLRELIISRGRTGYIAVYEYQAAHDRVLVHAIRHQREAGFEE